MSDMRIVIIIIININCARADGLHWANHESGHSLHVRCTTRICARSCSIFDLHPRRPLRPAFPFTQHPVCGRHSIVFLAEFCWGCVCYAYDGSHQPTQAWGLVLNPTKSRAVTFLPRRQVDNPLVTVQCRGVAVLQHTSVLYLIVSFHGTLKSTELSAKLPVRLVRCGEPVAPYPDLHGVSSSRLLSSLT